jgi:peptide/nickel transport system ATP-binding protein
VVEDKKPLLQVKDLKKHFPIVKGFFNKVVGQVKAVDGVSFDLFNGECLGLVGESGSGKTTVGRTILRALTPTAGKVLFQPDEDEAVVDIASASHAELKHLRPHMQMIFQDPYASLNPRMTVLDIVGEPLLVNGVTDKKEREMRVQDLLVRVGLKPHFLRRYPHAFSGGQRQRIGIARALALHPKLVICDEPVSALDVSVQAQALNLLQDLQEELGLTYLFVAHDLSVVRHISDRVAVMYVGKIVELSPVDQLYEKPLHPYTEALLSAVPVPNPKRKKKRVLLTGEVADPANAPSGCAFHPRCAYAQDLCREQVPELREIEPGHLSRCHFAETLQLEGQADL